MSNQKRTKKRKIKGRKKEEESIQNLALDGITYIIKIMIIVAEEIYNMYQSKTYIHLDSYNTFQYKY